MIIPRREDALHSLQLHRVLTAIADESQLSARLHFKGGTCAAMLGWLDRFSIDLDFDVKGGHDKQELRSYFHAIFEKLGLRIDDESKQTLQFFLKYGAPKPNVRTTIKVEALDEGAQTNIYQVSYFPEIDRYLSHQSLETMFAHKLVAFVDRYEKHGNVAGRDVYDIHHFFLSGFRYSTAVIEERRQTSVHKFFQSLTTQLRDQVTDKTLAEDLNVLLPPDTFKRLQGILRQETLQLLSQEMERLKK